MVFWLKNNYWEAGDSKSETKVISGISQRIKGTFESINRVISEAYVGDESYMVTGHINRAKLEKDQRKLFTTHAFIILGDRIEFDTDIGSKDIEIS